MNTHVILSLLICLSCQGSFTPIFTWFYLIKPQLFNTQVVGVSPTWGGGGAAGVADWVEDVEAGEGRELYPPREKLDYSDFREEIIRDDRPNRPHSRDSTLSKESRGSKEGKGKFLSF